MTNENEYAIEVKVGTAYPLTEREFVTVADAFFDLSGIFDHDLATADDVLTFSMVTPGADEVEALAVAMSAVRTAIHAAGGATPGWETGIRMLRTIIEKDATSELV
ncbi:hypothetical protein [Microbacterium sp.]|jgi:hypothetical protein|uniref:hypothetical protein n=1 Tax=Microbacterium sp. TaxID=51671 RepID=UPI00260E7FEC|nr:hypothetical protein [uncultured Microbacterium sp.]